MFDTFIVGQAKPEFANNQEGLMFDINDCGALAICYTTHPTEKLINSFDKSLLSFRFVEINGVIMMLLKIGDLLWCDAPYDPLLSINLTTKLEKPSDGLGLSVTIMLVDSRTGTIKAIRMVGLSTNFTLKLYDAIEHITNNPSPIHSYIRSIDIMERYSTKDLVRMAVKNRCDIR